MGNPHLLRVDRKWSLALTIWAVANFDLAGRILIEGAEYSSALPAIELHVFQLREDSGSSRYNAGNPHKGIQM